MTNEERKLLVSSHNLERELITKSNNSLVLSVIDLSNESTLLRGIANDLEVMLFRARESIIESNKRLEAAKVLNQTLELEMIQLRGQYDQLRLKLKKESV